MDPVFCRDFPHPPSCFSPQRAEKYCIPLLYLFSSSGGSHWKNYTSCQRTPLHAPCDHQHHYQSHKSPESSPKWKTKVLVLFLCTLAELAWNLFSITTVGEVGKDDWVTKTMHFPLFVNWRQGRIQTYPGGRLLGSLTSWQKQRWKNMVAYLTQWHWALHILHSHIQQ